MGVPIQKSFARDGGLPSPDLRALHAAVYAANEAAHYRECERLSERLYELASEEGDGSYASWGLFWHGAALDGGGRRREALAPFGRLFGRESQGFPSYVILKGMTRYIADATLIPVPLRTIEKALVGANTYLEQACAGNGHSRLLFVRTCLAAQLGQWGDAVRLGHQSCRAWYRDGNRYTLTSHMRILVGACIRAGDYDTAMRLVGEWRANEDSYCVTRDVQLAAANAEIAILRGSIREAIAYVEDVADAQRYSEVYTNRMALESVLIRACLCTDDPWAAKPSLLRLLQLRRTDVGHDRYEIMRLVGDYHLACARRAAGRRIVDFAAGSAIAPASPYRTTRASRKVGYHTSAATRAFRIAERIGREVDAQLECGWRTEEVRMRYRWNEGWSEAEGV